jgi:microcystin-dependent protein
MDGLIGEIRAFAFGYNPPEWIPCDGRSLSIQQYSPLFAVLGYTFGGTLNQTFNVPDIRALTVMGAGQGAGLTMRPFSSKAGNETIALTNQNMPSHDHTFYGYTGMPEATQTNIPVDNASNLTNIYSKNSAGVKTTLNGFVDPETNPVALSADSISTFGTSNSYTNGLGHENRSPFTTIFYCVCWNGLFPVKP